MHWTKVALALEGLSTNVMLLVRFIVNVPPHAAVETSSAKQLNGNYLFYDFVKMCRALGMILQRTVEGVQYPFKVIRFAWSHYICAEL